jgi:folate-binding protein YgfZ
MTDIDLQLDSLNNRAVIYDRSDIGRIRAVGSDVLDLLNRLSTNEVIYLPDNGGIPTVLTNEKGRIIDLITILDVGEYKLLMTGNGRVEIVKEWIEKYTFVEESYLEDTTSETFLASILGPKASGVIQDVFEVDCSKMELYQSVKVSLNSLDIQLLRTDPLKDKGFDIFAPINLKEYVWDAFLDIGVVKLERKCFDRQRILRGIPVSGKELTEEHNPLEAGLTKCINFSKGCYIGQEVVARLDTYDKLKMNLVTLQSPADTELTDGDILRFGGKQVGHVTSVVSDASFNLGLAYVRRIASNPGSLLSTLDDDKNVVEVLSIVDMFG